MTKYKLQNSSAQQQELFKRAPINFPTRAVYSSGPNKIFGVDLVDMSNRPDNGYRYILNAVDIYSRKACAVCMKSKNTTDIMNALRIVFVDLSKPVKIWSDQESALLSSTMKTYFSKIGVEVYHTFGRGKSAVVERFNRTMKEQMALNDATDSWSSFVPQFVKTYNSTEHSSINTTPDSAYAMKNNSASIENYKHYASVKREPKMEFRVGDRVRISVKKGVFEKKSLTENWSREVFTIVEVKMTNPTTYIIKDEHGEVIKGSFYKAELQKTSF